MLPVLRRAAARPPRRSPKWLPRSHLTNRFATRNSSSSSTTSTSSTQTRLDRLLSRLPRRLQPYASHLRSTPLSHVVAFLILHEITAVVPLLSLWALFHYTDYVPVSYVAGHWGAYVRDGVTRAERYFRRKGWFGFSRDDADANAGEGLGQELAAAGTETTAGQGGPQGTQDVLRRWATDDKYRVVVEVALAWAVTKALLPLRIVASVWATPWFAGVMGSARRLLSR